MNGNNSIFSSAYELLSEFGRAYGHTVSIFFKSVFSRPLLFILKTCKRFIRLLFRGLVMFFSPASAQASFWADDVTRASKKCLKVLFTQPGSFLSVFFYYVKKAFGRYEFRPKNIFIWLFPAIVLSAAVICFGFVSQRSVALLVFADGSEIGCVESEADFLEARNAVKDTLGSDAEEGLLPDITYSLALVSPDRFTNTDTLYERLLSMTESDTVNACGVYIDGELISVLMSETQARSVFDELLEEKAKQEENYVVSFAQTVEYKQGLYPEDSVEDTDSLEELLLGKTVKETYLTKQGDTVASVSEKYSMTAERLRELNSLEAETEELQEGVSLDVELKESILSFREVRTEITAEAVEYSRIEIESSALYSGSTRVLLEGKDGYDQVTSFVTYVDGEKVSSAEVSRLTVTDAVPERVQVGTKPLDEAYSNSMGGIFLWPIVGAYGINSDYGYRWGKLHGGLDLGMGGAAGTSLGKNIVAVAQGTVIVAGVHSSYGYYVIIDHGNGLQTLYAHCLAQSLMVVPGQTVVAGQPIARVGSTGYSTGPHLHFEVRVNGNRVNPRPYLGI